MPVKPSVPVVFTGVFQHAENGVWEARICWVLKSRISEGFCHGLTVRGVLDRPSAGGSWNLALDETEPFYIGGSMKRLDISRAVHGLAERRRGRSKATDAARPTGLWLSYRRDGQPLTRSSAPDDDIPQIASAFGLLDPRPIIHQSLAD